MLCLSNVPRCVYGVFMEFPLCLLRVYAQNTESILIFVTFLVNAYSEIMTNLKIMIDPSNILKICCDFRAGV